MIYFGLFLLILIGFIFYLSHKKNLLLESFLHDLKDEVNGVLVKGSILSNPKLLVSVNDFEVVVSYMVAGAKAGGSAGRQAVWYVNAQLVNRDLAKFRVKLKQTAKDSSSMKFACEGGNPRFADFFDVNPDSDPDLSLITIVFNEDMMFQFCEILKKFPDTKVSLLNNVITLSLPYSVVKSSVDLKNLLVFIGEVIARSSRHSS